MSVVLGIVFYQTITRGIKQASYQYLHLCFVLAGWAEMLGRLVEVAVVAVAVVDLLLLMMTAIQAGSL